MKPQTQEADEDEDEDEKEDESGKFACVSKTPIVFIVLRNFFSFANICTHTQTTTKKKSILFLLKSNKQQQQK